jgi:hypothetical protein
MFDMEACAGTMNDDEQDWSIGSDWVTALSFFQAVYFSA